MIVPKYEKQVKEQSLPNVRFQQVATPDAYGAQIAKGIKGLGTDISIMAEKMQEEENTNRVLEATDKWRKFDLSYRNDAEKGVFTKLNKDALGSYEQAQLDYQKIYEDISSSFTNDEQRSAFFKFISGSQQSALASIARHESQQRQNWTIATSKQTVQTSIDMASANYTDDDICNQAILQGVGAIKVAYEGMGEDYIKEAIDSFKSDVHSARIGSYLSNDDADGASEYLETHVDEIEGTTRNKLIEAVDKATLLKRVQENGEAIFNKFGVNDEQAAIKYVMDNYEGDEENKLKAYVESLYVDERRFKQIRDKEQLEWVTSQLKGVESYSEALKVVERYSKDPYQYQALKSMAEAMFGEGAIKTDMGKFVEAHKKIYDGDIKDEIDLYGKYGKDISPSDIKVLITDLERMESSKASSQASVINDAIKTQTAQDKQYFSLADDRIDAAFGTTKDGKDKRAKAKFILRETVSNADDGKGLHGKDIMMAVDDILKDVNEGWGKTYYFEKAYDDLKEGKDFRETLDAKYGGSAMVEEAINFCIENNLPLDERNIAYYYEQKGGK